MAATGSAPQRNTRQRKTTSTDARGHHPSSDGATIAQARTRFGQLYGRRAFKPVARFIADRRNEEDRLQDAVAQVYEMDQRYAARGKLLEPALLVHACRLRAIDHSRRFVKSDAQPARDVLHPSNFTSGKVQVHRLDGLIDPETGGFNAEGDRALELGLADELTANPSRKISSAIDLVDWLETLTAVDREMLAHRLAGFTLSEIAEEQGRSITAVFTRLHELGHRLADRMGVPVPSRRAQAAAS